MAAELSTSCSNPSSKSTKPVPDKNHLSVISYNMHGFNQGFSTVRDLCLSDNPDVFLLQEHWLLPCNLSKFDQIFPDYFNFGTSAMCKAIEFGVIRGRPFGGVIILIKKYLQKKCTYIILV